MSKNNLFPCIDISGTPYEIGLTHGKVFKKQVLHIIETYFYRFGNANVNFC